MKLLLCVAAVVLPALCSYELEAMEADWIDPNDPSTGSRMFGAKPLGQCDNEEVTAAPDPTLRLILRRLFQQLNVDPSQRSFFTRNAMLTLSTYDMSTVAEFLDKETPDASQKEQVRGALHNMIKVIDEDAVSPYESALTFLWPWVVLLNMAILPPAAFFVLRSIMSTRKFWLTMLSLIILVSMVATYNKMYQEKVAARIAASMEMKGDACAPTGLIEQGLDFLQGLVSLKKKSPCLKFIETQTVSIVAEISLLDVFSHVLSNGLFGWISSLGSHLNKFYRDLFDGIPFHMQIILLASMIFFFVKIRTPFFTIEPLFISMVGTVAGHVVHGLTGDEQHPALPSAAKEHHPALGSPKRDRFHKVTPRTPERVRRLQERHKKEKATKALPAPDSEENTTLGSDSGGESSHSRSRSLSRGREGR